MLFNFWQFLCVILGKHQPEVEPEPLDLPEDLNLDNEEQKDEEQEENPFDVDAMKGMFIKFITVNSF